MPTEMDTTEFLGIEFANLTYQEVLSELDKLSHAESFSYVVTPNVDHVVQLYEGPDKSVRMLFNEAYKDAAFRFCDSRILQLLARIQGVKLEVVTGSDLTALLFESGYLEGRKVALVGGDDRILRELSARFPNVGLVQHQPPMKLLCDHKAREAVKNFMSESGCNFVLFAVGAPQSEIIAHACRNDEQAKGVGICVGASIEFLLGRKTRAPQWMRRLGLEWLFRLVKEPRRLSRRYLVDGPKIFKVWLCR
jgi:N-acetylglucosaminyldiphosphoundecaprenol N-acetyl-beta-D-mannosaminyltransferase